MPLSLICACGARIELEDAMAGQDIACPECQQPLKAPASAADRQPVRTSALALASLVLALVGAFTIVGSMAAVLLGLVACAVILRYRDRLAGFGYAAAGIFIGFFATALTTLTVFLGVIPSVGGYAREQQMKPFLKTDGTLEVEVPGRNWTLTRPTNHWGVARDPRTVNDLESDMFLDLDLIKTSPDVLLVQPRMQAFIDATQLDEPAGTTLAEFNKQVLEPYVAKEDFYGGRTSRDMAKSSPAKEGKLLQIIPGKVKDGRLIHALPGYPAHESEVRLQAGGKQWVLLLRVYRKDATGPPVRGARFYVLRAYMPHSVYEQNKDEIMKALDSFRFAD